MFLLLVSNCWLKTVELDFISSETNRDFVETFGKGKKTTRQKQWGFINQLRVLFCLMAVISVCLQMGLKDIQFHGTPNLY